MDISNEKKLTISEKLIIGINFTEEEFNKKRLNSNSEFSKYDLSELILATVNSIIKNEARIQTGINAINKIYSLL
jgi:hypothetical protein